MGIRLDDFLAELPEDEQAAIAAFTARLIEKEATLRQLRESCDMTQVEVGEAMGVLPAAVSKVEQRTAANVLTLDRQIRAMGGELYIIAKLPNKHPVRITGIGLGAKTDVKPRRKGRPAKSGGDPEPSRKRRLMAD